MFENILVAGWYRLPIVMATVNRTLGPPWNIWADQTDTLCMRDGSWVQIYCENNQEVADSILLAFRMAEDHRILLPVLVSMDAFIVSHTQQETNLPEQEQVDRYLPPLDLPHRMRHDHPVTIGGLAWPRETLSQRLETQEAMEQVPVVFEECRAEFEKVFGREAPKPVDGFETDDAETILVCSGTIATTAREIVRARREKGEKVGLITQRMMRPYPRETMIDLCKSARKVGVLDRNYSGGVGGIFWLEMKSALQGARDDLLIQNYLTGLCGGDVVPSMVEACLDDLIGREQEVKPIWKGIDE
jgi:pyruvate/2-oxoacid:ferredoxin oxidoreductase alpha subunit